jgi:hypothetical protein
MIFSESLCSIRSSARARQAVAHYPFGDKGRCNGLGLDARNHVLFAACANSGNPPAQPAQPMMVILSAEDGKIFTSLPLAGGSDGAVFNPSTMEARQFRGRPAISANFHCTDMSLMRAVLKSASTDDLKSYDLVWLLHLVGDVHQPLHFTTRVSAGFPTGDAGGNDVEVLARIIAPI